MLATKKLDKENVKMKERRRKEIERERKREKEREREREKDTRHDVHIILSPATKCCHFSDHV